MPRGRIAALLHRRDAADAEATNGAGKHTKATRDEHDSTDRQWDVARLADVVRELVPVARIDTLYADLYLHRARSVLAPVLDEEAYRAALRARDEECKLVSDVEAAIEREAWDDVRAMSTRLSALRSIGDERRQLVEAAEPVYGFAEELVDPFSPGLYAIAGLADAALPSVRDDVVRRLERLQDLDTEWKELYRARRDAFVALQFGPARAREREAPRRAQADEALHAGDYELLARLASEFDNAHATESEAVNLPSGAGALTFGFSAETVARAARLGLVPVHVDSFRHRIDSLGVAPLLWRPTQYEEGSGAPVRISSPQIPQALRERIELYLNRPFLNSGGARDIPPLVEEDLLVEDFEEPAPSAPPANPLLLEALGLPRRNGLSRIAIERALLVRGRHLVEQLGLAPREFRLVCIPQDLHVRIGEVRGWGSQPLWTHLDGRMVLRNRKSLVLAGGNSQFGGIYDLVGLGRNYDSERLVARFAVVLRRRMAAW